MTRSADFTHTVRCGVRSAQPDIVVHARRVNGDGNTPLIGLIVAKSVGGAVQRHRVARKLRHAARSVLGELNPADRVVIRALPGSFGADSARLTAELRTGVRRALEVLEQRR